jgi:hypothetical protein
MDSSGLIDGSGPATGRGAVQAARLTSAWSVVTRTARRLSILSRGRLSDESIFRCVIVASTTDSDGHRQPRALH